MVCWLIYLGLAIWQRASHSVQPPWGDGLSYVLKAVNFWKAFDSGNFFNPLNLAPTGRPPGTILMSYPLGLTHDFRGYHFRSIFLPLLCIVAAVYIVAGKAQAKASEWLVAAMAFLFSSLPMFYWLDWNHERWINNGWGMVDNFQAGIAAMAIAAVLRSHSTRSRSWLLFGSVLASFTLLVKPSGLMVMALAAVTWLMLIALELVTAARFQRPEPSLRAYAVGGGALIITVYALVLVPCKYSDYLSWANFEYARQSLAVFRKESGTFSILPLINFSAGRALPLWVLGVIALLVHRIFVATGDAKATLLKASAFLVAAFMSWISGMWYWLVVQSGSTQIRYFYPFLVMGCICVGAAALQYWPRVGRTAGLVMTACCLIPAANIAALLLAGDSPSSRWQYETGVSVMVGGEREEVAQTQAFLEEVRKTQTDRKIYYFPNGISAQTFIYVAVYEKIMQPRQAGLYQVQPQDWTRGFAVRINELLDCDYVLVPKYSDEYLKQQLAAVRTETFDAESKLFESWLSTLDEHSGLEVASDGRKLRVLRVANRKAFSRAIEEFISTREWRPEFREANRLI